MAGDHLFQKILDLRGRYPAELTVEDAMQALNLTERAEVVGMLQRAEQRGFGRFVVGRGSNKTRIIWKSPDTLYERQPPTVSDEGTTAARASLSHVFPLKEFNVELRLPRDLTSSEAERISKFVTSLASDSS
jgi:hypothetical protein